MKSNHIDVALRLSLRLEYGKIRLFHNSPCVVKMILFLKDCSVGIERRRDRNEFQRSVDLT